LISFVGAANSPFEFQLHARIKAPDQFDTKTNKKIVPKNGTQHILLHQFEFLLNHE
jgi:hypothetical protein